jgi:hypothetical protein
MEKVNGKKNLFYKSTMKTKQQTKYVISMMDIMSLIKSMDMESFNGNQATNIWEIIMKMKDKVMEL